ncbi:MAG TPA: hypothetical protein VMT03_13180 [Polyangia bacterium]|nr:hypothetical protein [Polyangia bacterium]
MAVEASVRTLRAFLKDEREAASRYRRALPRFTDRAETDELNACLASHERRIATLEGWIRRMGGPQTGDGDEDGDEDEEGDGGDAIRALEESEDRSLKHYLDDVGKLDGDTRRLVAREILPEQVRTYDWVNDLRLNRLD